MEKHWLEDLGEFIAYGIVAGSVALGIIAFYVLS